ncbi:MAG: mechanosensitive ion channel [Dysgonamonadaceae bacterium]|jgi:small conductance mechanosensitive channel|nr:mechanosensitive ion channel [Dysgonamonadaceae bacterium]
MDSLKDIENISWWENTLHTLRDNVLNFGLHLLLCIVIYFVGRKLIKYVKVFVNKLLSRQNFDPSVVSFLKSVIDIVLTAALLITIVNILGINNSSFVAILASAGVAMGMAMSGTLQNFAGGVMILVFRPYRIGDYIQAQGQEGTVKEIHIFNTEITTIDNKTVFIPNGGLSSNVIVNYNNENTRRIDMVIGVEYGTDYDFAKSTIKDILQSDERIELNPAPFIALKTLNESSVDILIRVWVNTSDYWDVYFNLNEQIYKIFGKKGIGIPFPQMTVHWAEKDRHSFPPL